MKVSELIKQLRKMNQNAEVTIMDIEGNFNADVLQVEDNKETVYLLAEL